MDQAAIGNRIKTMRERANLTQEQLAELVDISPTHMSVIERGVKTPKLDTFVRIANALGVSADVLLQDVVDHANESILSELSATIGKMPKSEQTRILNAIRALVAQIRKHVQEGHIVRLESLGSFQAQLSSEGTSSEEEFNPSFIRKVKPLKSKTEEGGTEEETDV